MKTIDYTESPTALASTAAPIRDTNPEAREFQHPKSTEPALKPPSAMDAAGKEQGNALGPFRKAGILALALIVLGAAAAGSWQLWRYMSAREETDNAYVEGHVHLIASRISGTVTKVLVDDNQWVRQGEVLVRLDPRDYQVEVQQQLASLELSEKQAEASARTIVQTAASAQSQDVQAESDGASARATIASAASGVNATEAELRQAEAAVRECDSRLETAKLDYDRYGMLWEQRAISKQQYDNAKMAYEVAGQQKSGAEQKVAQAKALLLQSHSTVQDAYARLTKARSSQLSALAGARQVDVQRQLFLVSTASAKKARSALDRALLDLSYTEIKAPASGRVGRKSVEVGHMISPGQPLMAVVEHDCWVTANFKETQVGRMSPGQPVELKIDAFPGRVFKGHVESIAPASGAKFAVLPPDNATGNFTKIVQRIPVKICFDEASTKDIKGRITPGMSVMATVLAGR